MTIKRKFDSREETQIVQALEGIKIIDLSRFAPGPFCTMILGDFGADIIKVEEIGTPTGRRVEQIKGLDTALVAKEYASPNSPEDLLNRNKRSIRLNLKTTQGQQIFYQLAEKADVVVEGFRPGVTKRLGIDYETLKKKNKRLIYCAVTGFGQDGPYRDIPGHDINYISQAGVLGALGLPGAPPPFPGNLVGDIAGGSLQAAIGILMALAAREKTGLGQFVDISITDGAVAMLSQYFGRYYETGNLPLTGERVTCGAAPYYNVYPTMDGKLISIGCSEPWFFANICHLFECEQFIPFENDIQKSDEIMTYFKQKFLSRTREEWFNILSKADIPATKVLSLDEVENDPHIKHRQMVVELDGPGARKVKQTGIPIKLSETPGKVKNIGSRPGEDTTEILLELGYSEKAIQDLYAGNVVAKKS
jgi:crotonobetainyl-CoA:carnitine CoA-transferase CaiB-like acyl-CoA transferase